jgi:hypothetical protein
MNQMSKSEYTKGLRTVYAPITGFTDHWIVESDDADLLVTIEGGDNQKADAYLIAAAPDLLEACEAAYRAMTDDPKNSDAAWMRYDDAVEMVRAAIAKAKGEETLG